MNLQFRSELLVLQRRCRCNTQSLSETTFATEAVNELPFSTVCRTCRLATRVIIPASPGFHLSTRAAKGIPTLTGYRAGCQTACVTSSRRQTSASGFNLRGNPNFDRSMHGGPTGDETSIYPETSPLPRPRQWTRFRIRFVASSPAESTIR